MNDRLVHFFADLALTTRSLGRARPDFAGLSRLLCNGTLDTVLAGGPGAGKTCMVQAAVLWTLHEILGLPDVAEAYNFVPRTEVSVVYLADNAGALVELTGLIVQATQHSKSFAERVANAGPYERWYHRISFGRVHLELRSDPSYAATGLNIVGLAVDANGEYGKAYHSLRERMLSRCGRTTAPTLCLRTARYDTRVIDLGGY